jgi:ADP-ribose pyrophosphatase YjhB (NUDIX family)
MKYCSECGAKLIREIPDGDNRERYVCSSCSVIHYQNPKIIVGTLPVAGDKVLLCRRAIEPRKGFWTLPAGFMENGETTLAGAQRETSEEAEASIINESLYRLFDLPYINQVYIFYRGELANNQYGTGPESMDAALFAEDEIPWQEIAFPVVAETLREYFLDRKAGLFPVRVSGIDPKWWGRRGKG